MIQEKIIEILELQKTHTAISEVIKQKNAERREVVKQIARLTNELGRTLHSEGVLGSKGKGIFVEYEGRKYCVHIGTYRGELEIIPLMMPKVVETSLAVKKLSKAAKRGMNNIV